MVEKSKLARIVMPLALGLSAFVNGCAHDSCNKSPNLVADIGSADSVRVSPWSYEGQKTNDNERYFSRTRHLLGEVKDFVDEYLVPRYTKSPSGPNY